MSRRATRSVLQVYVRIASPKRNEVLPSTVALRRFMANRFDVMTIRVEHEGAEIILVVMGAKARQAVVPTAGLDGRLIECLHALAVRGLEGHVGVGLAGLALADPEVGLLLAAEAGAFVAAAHLRGDFHDERDA